MKSQVSPRRFGLLVATLMLVVIAGCAGTPSNPNPLAARELTLADVDLPRYMGRWYIIANIPYFAERGFVASRAEWRLREDGKIDDSFVGLKGGFDGPEKRYQFVDRVVPDTGNARWRVQLVWPISVTQLTLYVDPDYQYTILGYPDKSLGWIFARTPTIGEGKYRELLGKLEEQGYDVSRFMRVPQKREQLGQPGFATP